MQNFIVTGINTDVGKTFVSAVLFAGLQCNYWKPIQTGTDINSDSDFIRDFSPNNQIIFPESYRFKGPFSPHKAAKIENQVIDIQKITLPSENNLLIEGAGGLMVPLNDHDLLIDLVEKWKFPVVLVVNCYLGAINHTLLSLEMLDKRNIPLKGIIFNQTEDIEAENFISNYKNVPILGKIPHLDSLPKTIKDYQNIYNKYISWI